MKNISIISIALVTLLFGCKKEDAKNDTKDISSIINSYPIESLNSDETTSLIIMREEEKLAHDVYISLYNKWGVNIFSNIASSEQTHTNAVLTLLNKYEIADPVNTNTIGVFSDTSLQSLYNQLLEMGSASQLDALKVGATIEDLDIYDLNNWMTKVDNEDIKYVYEQLNKGSRNHLRSFYSQVISSGGSYSAQYISQSEMDAIIASAKETGSW